MKPVLVSFGFGGHPVTLHTYGVAIALGFAVAIVLAARQARRWEMSTADILDLSFWMLVAGLAGSRVLFVLLNLGDFARRCAEGDPARSLWSAVSDCTSALRIWEGGLVFYGGVAGATGVAVIMARRRGWAFAKVADLFAPPLAIGHALGRVGCFAAGCCFGKACPPGSPFGARFPPGSVAFDDLARHGLVRLDAAATPALHPTQLYEAAGELVIFFLLLVARRRQRAFGYVALIYALLYAGLRGAVEIFRGDAGRKFVVEVATPRLAAGLGLPAAEPLLLSVSQATSLVVIVAAGWALRLLSRAREPEPAQHGEHD